LENMKVNNRLIAILTIMLFAGNMLTLLPAFATVGGSLHIELPDKVAAGGPIYLDTTAMTATGGSMYFYLSLDDDPEISTGDIYFATVKTADGIAEMQTVFLTASVAAEEYYVKGVDIKGVGKACVVTDNTVEVIAEALPSAVNNDPTGHVDDMPEIEITDAGDYDTADLYWKTFADVPAPYTLLDGEVTIDNYAIPDAYKGTYKIVILLTGTDGTYATYVEFEITPDVTSWGLPGGISILADELNQDFVISGTGFPEGTVAENSIVLTLKNFMTGSTIDVYEALNGEIDVDDGTVLAEGRLDLPVTVDGVEAGVLDVKIPVDSSSVTFDAAFYSSTPTEEVDFAVISNYKMSATSGQNEDDVTFSFINLPASAAVTIRWIGTTVTLEPPMAATADLYGAYDDTWTIVDLPGGAYQVRAVVTTGVTTRERTMGTFTVLPKFHIDLDEAVVGDFVDITGTGFPADAIIQTSFFGPEEVDIDPDINVLATGYFELLGVEVPHVSGGGKAVTVKVEGEDVDGVLVTASSTIIINPSLDLATSEAIAVDGDWVPFDTATIFPGHVVKLIGAGFLASETLTVSLYDENDKLVGTAIVGDGEKADGDGDLELVAWLPNAKVLYPAGKPLCYLKVAGSTSTNKVESDPFDVAGSDDVTAFIVQGLANDGDIDEEVAVGDTSRVVGFGFRTKTLPLILVNLDTGDSTDIKSVTSVNGYFDTSFTIPAVQGYWDGEHYDVMIDLAGFDGLYGHMDLYPKITLTPSSGFVDSKFSVAGTGFEDGTDFDITWVGIMGDEVLDTVDGGDVEDGSFTIEVSVPSVVPQSYKVEATDTVEVWDSAVYTVADKSAVQMNQTLTDILAQLKALDLATLNTNVQGAQTAATAAGTKADAAATAATAAGVKADAAAAAATAAGVKADAAAAAATAAKTSADSASSAANGLTTLIYAAIGASLIAALAAIVALMQISRKIA